MNTKTVSDKYCLPLSIPKNMLTIKRYAIKGISKRNRKRDRLVEQFKTQFCERLF